MQQIEAQAILDEVNALAQRSGQYMGYWRQGAFVQWWGAVWLAAHLLIYFVPARAGTIWLGCDLAGAIGCAALRMALPRAARADARLIWAMLIVALFGTFASFLLVRDARAVEVFWTCLAMCGYMIGGLWAGRRWIVLGAAVSAAAILSYCFLGQSYHLVMAAAGGGGLLLGGTWLRHAGGLRAG